MCLVYPPFTPRHMASYAEMMDFFLSGLVARIFFLFLGIYVDC